MHLCRCDRLLRVMTQSECRTPIRCLLLAVGMLILPMGADRASAEEAGEDEVVLLGALTRSRVEDAAPDWIEEQIAATPDTETTLEVLAAIAGAEIVVFMGTWCEDSRRELSRFWRGLDEAGAVSPLEITYYGVDRDKQRPRDLIAGQDLLYVPTIIVRREGVEVGRIVEEAPDGIEFELLALLTGEKTGLITARSDL